jgi:hypothetical protein
MMTTARMTTMMGTALMTRTRTTMRMGTTTTIRR